MSECILEANKELASAVKGKEQRSRKVELETDVREAYLKLLKSHVEQVSSAKLRGLAKESLPDALRVHVYNQIRIRRDVLQRLLTAIHKEREDVKKECCVLSKRIEDLTRRTKDENNALKSAYDVQKLNDLRRQQISEFLGEIEARKKRKGEEKHQMLTPDQLLTNLLHKGSGNYIEVGADVLPAHLDIFLRSGIVLPHPTEPDYVCLNDF